MVSSQTCARLRLVARDLSDAQAVLSSLPSPELFPGVTPTLELLAAARRDVVACVSVPAPGPSNLPQLALRSLAPHWATGSAIGLAEPQTRPDRFPSSWRPHICDSVWGWEARR